MDTIAEYIQRTFAEQIDMKLEDFLYTNLTLAQIVSRSPLLHNSVDLMEAFAKTANALKREYGIRLRLPAFPLDTPISEVLSSFVSEVEKSTIPLGVKA